MMAAGEGTMAAGDGTISDAVGAHSAKSRMDWASIVGDTARRRVVPVGELAEAMSGDLPSAPAAAAEARVKALRSFLATKQGSPAPTLFFHHP